jgi:transcriptional regulator with PAS, ATPase and Fis domain
VGRLGIAQSEVSTFTAPAPERGLDTMHVVSTAESQRAIRAAEVEAANEAEPQTAIKGKRATRAVSWTAPRIEQIKPAPLRAHLGAIRQFGRVVARSAAMHEVFEVLERFAQTDVTVTLCGETGVGKDILAHALHERSARANGPLVVFDCGAVAANLAESELLGHERGAFTGAVSAHAGAFERAHGGTLFLDEIAELPVDLQPRLLRALESRRVRRVGGRVDRRVDVRVVAATNRDLRADVAAGRFREDLFFRLAVAVVSLPPLRKRLDDLPQLVYSLLADLGQPDLRVSDAAFTALRAHAWPGNVRELKNALACAIAFVETGAAVLEQKHLRLLTETRSDTSSLDGLPLAGQALERIERAAIRQTLAQAEGNKMYAARALGIAVSTLYEKLKKYGL